MYEISNDLQEKIIKYLSIDKKFFAEFRDTLKQIPWSNIVFSDIIGIITKLWEKGCNEISITILENEVQRLHKKRNSEIPISIYESVLNNLKSTELSDDEKKYIQKILHEVYELKIIQLSINDIQDDLSSNNPDLNKIHNVLKSVQQLKVDKLNILEHDQNIKEFIFKRYEQKGGKIPTGIKLLDKYLRGGFGKQEIAIFAGSSGIGKSNLLINFIYSALRNGKNVLFISAELSELIIIERLNMRICRCVDEDLINHIDDVEKYIEKFYHVLGGKLFIQPVPSRSSTVQDIELVIEYLKLTKDFFPDIIVLDYLELFKTDAKIEKKDWLLLDHLTMELRNIAKKYDISLVTVTQCNVKAISGGNEGMTKFPLNELHIAGSYGKIKEANIVATICQSKDLTALYLIKNTNNPDVRKLIPLKMLTDKMIIIGLEDESREEN